MAHYAVDCWNSEIECSYGWIECVGIADRSTYDLRSHSEKSGVALVAREKFTKPKEVEKVVITTDKKVLGHTFKGNHKMVTDALEAMDKEVALEMQDVLDFKGEVEYKVCTLEKTVTITKKMASIKKEKQKVYQGVFTPCVIEPSFGISQIMYCLLEHSFYMRPSKDGNEALKVLRLLPLVSYIKCFVFPLVQNKQYEEVAERISKSLRAAGISNKKDFAGTSIGKRYAISDESGVPFLANVDNTSSVTIRERDSKDQIRVSVEDVVKVVKNVTKGKIAWMDLLKKYPAHTN